jgi:3,4-dihydroxy 2-butanone 4-phosphate synthase/GTP cyclohydrolase II
MMSLNSIEEIIEEIRQGNMVIIMDDEDRENEGDLVMAATQVRPDDINFMARYGRGLICLTLTAERCRQLRLPLMVNTNLTTHSTNFTVSIEAAKESRRASLRRTGPPRSAPLWQPKRSRRTWCSRGTCFP